MEYGIEGRSSGGGGWKPRDSATPVLTGLVGTLTQRPNNRPFPPGDTAPLPFLFLLGVEPLALPLLVLIPTRLGSDNLGIAIAPLICSESCRECSSGDDF